jgi:hypothetical protein
MFTLENSSQNITVTSVIFKELAKVNIRPISENSPNLFTLVPPMLSNCFFLSSMT